MLEYFVLNEKMNILSFIGTTFVIIAFIDLHYYNIITNGNTTKDQHNSFINTKIR